MIIKLKNLINYFLFLIISSFIKNKNAAYAPGTMLIIRLDAIGDYILFRNFIRVVKEDEKYKNYKITLCGNIIWKDLAESLDKKFIDSFLWIDRKKFYGNIIYKYSILKEVSRRKFEVVVNPTYTREILYGDEIVWASNAALRIGNQGVLDKHAKWKRNLFTDNYYTRLLPADNENLFEFYRNKEFFENFLEKKINLARPIIETAKLKTSIKLSGNYAVIFPGAKDGKRIWSYLNFIKVANYLINNWGVKIVIPGAAAEKELTGKIVGGLIDQSKVIDLTGKTNLTELVQIIGGARILISNETGPVHIAAAVGTAFLCISNGNHLGRFNPYPADIFVRAFYIYPDEVKQEIERGSAVINELRFDSEIDINKINASEVIEKLKIIMPKFSNN